MKKWSSLVAVFFAVAAVIEVQANCGTCVTNVSNTTQCSAGGCCGSTCAGGACTDTTAVSAPNEAAKGCPIAAAMEQLPKLTYAVGDKKTCCPKEAAKLVGDSGGHIHYCVVSKEYDSEAEAMKALVAATETFVAAATKPHKCPKSGQLTLAGHVQSCEKSAAATSQVMQTAMDKIQLTYVVGDKQCNCPVEAGKIAKETGKERLFVVGAEKTACEQTARLNLARAKYKAAVEAMVKSQSAAAKSAPTT